MEAVKKEFPDKIIHWYLKNKRVLPWRETDDPYIIWLSEVILQQTQVKQGLPYFKKFIAYFPDIHALAQANEQYILKLWEGLGYYTRARNMLKTAKTIVEEYKGQFPDSYNALMKLQGIGPYSAAAIVSFAFNKPHAVIDGNVYRVLSRYFAIKTPIDSIRGKKQFSSLANSLIDKKRPGLFNQAIMEFGAIHCTTYNPKCVSCPFMSDCKASQTNTISDFPVKSKKIVRKDRFFNYLVLNRNDHVYLSKRERNDIWKNLYEFPLIETKDFKSEHCMNNSNEWKRFFRDVSCSIKYISNTYKQTLTHQRIHARFWEIEIAGEISDSNRNFILVKKNEIKRFPFSKIITCFINEKNINFNDIKLT